MEQIGELDERKTKILNAIIRTYLETGEPVGSRTISKDADVNVSSATIRNEMSDLEEMGYIVQPHTSAGRIPSDKGYRFYVDHLISEKDAQIQEMKDFVIAHTSKMEEVLKQVAKMLAANTNYATMISSPTCVQKKIKFIQLSPVDECQLLTVVVMDGNIIKNKIIDVPQKLDQETLFKMSMLLNNNLNGLTANEINLSIIKKLKEQAGEYENIVDDVLKVVSEAIEADDDVQIYTSGATNIFKYPELSDAESATKLIHTLEEKQDLAQLVTKNLGDDKNTGIQVYIGDEGPIQDMKDCSVVTATYELQDGVKGTIGIIGPKRMDYEKVMDSLTDLKEKLDTIFQNKDEK
ncbi:MAG: heat-inducible transcriptional repressor HrcA [Lachnospiraceae bacterium]